MNINYEYYRVFYYAVKNKSLTKAAEALHNSQPNISRTIQLLEEQMGCKLLLRSNRGISLTLEGEKLYFHVKAAVEQLQTAEAELAELTGKRKGSVSIGASETALRMALLPTLGSFKAQYPEIRIRIMNNLTIQAIHSVKRGLVDFAVVTGPAVMEKPLVSYPLLRFHDILIGGKSYASYKRKKLSLMEAAQCPLVFLGEGTTTYQFYERFFRENNVELKPELESATIEQMLLMVKNDLGIGFIPEPYAKEALEKGEICRLCLQEEIPPREISFVENAEQPLSVAANELKRLLMPEKCS